MTCRWPEMVAHMNAVCPPESLTVKVPAGLLPLIHPLLSLSCRGISLLSFPLVWSTVVLVLGGFLERILLFVVHERVHRQDAPKISHELPLASLKRFARTTRRAATFRSSS